MTNARLVESANTSRGPAREDALDRLRAVVDAAAASPASREAALVTAPGGDARAARQQAVRLLSIRGYSRQELRRRLLRKHEPVAVDAAIEALAGTPFLDDAAWARAYVSGLRGRERSSGLLRRELAAQGVRGEDVTQALAAHDDVVAALAAARRRTGALARLDAPARERRLRDYLLRRGFSGAAVREALAGALGGG